MQPDNSKLVDKVAEKFRAEEITVGTSIENAKTGQMFAFDAKKLARIAIPLIREELEAEQPKCPGEIIQRPARLMGATYSDDDINKGDEHFVPCPLLAEIRKSIEAERLEGTKKNKYLGTNSGQDKEGC